MGKKIWGAIALSVGASLAGCSDSSDRVGIEEEVTPPPPQITPPPEEPTTDEQLRALVDANGLTGDPAAGRELPDISDPLAQLGMKLFFSKSLGGDTDSACVTCHHPALGGGDDLPLPIGVHADVVDLLGPGRLHSSAGFGFDGGPTVPRNAPTTFNIGLWDQVLFHDGRVESLGKTAGRNGDDGEGVRTPDSPFDEADPRAVNLAQAQALFPVTSPEEMRAEFLQGESNQAVRDGLAARLVDQEIPNTWLEEFQAAFGSDASASELITYANVAMAIGEYERSQVFVDNSWRAYVEGDDSALTEAQKRGALLFYTSAAEGGAECVACHSGDFFSDEQFHVLAMPQVGRGKGDGESGDDDFGRLRETGEEGDRYAFRTPSLLNVTATGPWTHAGAYLSLDDVVRHHLDPAGAIGDYDFSLADLNPGMQGAHAEGNTRRALDQLDSLRAAGNASLPETDLGEEDVADLVAFLQALADPCVEDRDCLAPWVAEMGDTGPDSLQLNGVDGDGDAL
jgi:cytochrome c peroxidase